MKRIRFNEFGEAGQVAYLEEVDKPVIIKPNQVGVALIASPINPSDLLTASGLYGVSPVPLPSGLGKEALGRVAEVGSEVKKVKPGDVVYLSPVDQAWSEYFVVSEKMVTPVPGNEDSDLLQLCMGVGNPLTAYIMLDRYGDLKEGDWLIQNAANSGVGINVIKLAKQRGISTINIVRSEHTAEQLRELGADCVVVCDGKTDVDWQSVTEGKTIKLGLDAIGGLATETLASCLCPGGMVVNYGLLSGENCQISAHNTVFKDITLKGFWLSAWFRPETFAYVQETLSKLMAQVAEGALQVPIEAAYPLVEFKQALTHASRQGRSGKIVFTGPGFEK